uniref:Uncharacterized protein n=1 Tax=Cricetulus griseus TaxID=10029 RepID=A0A8C2LKN8_CRIGR
MQVGERLQGVQAGRVPRGTRLAAAAAQGAGAAGLLRRLLHPAGARVSHWPRPSARRGLGQLRGGGHLALPSR